MNLWLDMLREKCQAHGLRRVAERLGVSPATVSLINNGRYTASTANIEARVAEAFGQGGRDCPVLGRIEAAECLENLRRAQAFGARATGNPASYRLYRACQACRAGGLSDG